MQQVSFEFQQTPGFPCASPILLLRVLAAELTALFSRFSLFGEEDAGEERTSLQ
jgi:hypothetical protein